MATEKKTGTEKGKAESAPKSRISGTSKADVSDEKRHVSPRKVKALKEIVNLVKTSRTTTISSAINIPSAQLQKMRKMLKKNKTELKLVKKKLGMKALEQSLAKDLVGYLEASSIVLFSQLDPFELSEILAENKFPARAKAGQVATQDIIVEAQTTDMMPGPILTELQAAGLKSGIDKGKVSIKETKTVAAKGEKIKKEVAEILVKLEIYPFQIGLDSIASYDSKDNAVYKAIKIDKQKLLANIAKGALEAQTLAIEIAYPTIETIKFIISKAALAAQAIDALEAKEEIKTEEQPAQVPTELQAPVVETTQPTP